MLICYCDGYYCGKDKIGTYGYYIEESGVKLYEGRGVVTDPVDSYQMEFVGLNHLLDVLIRMGFSREEIEIRSDCLNLVNHMRGEWRVRRRKAGFIKEYYKAKSKFKYFACLNIVWIPRERNKYADHLCLEAVKDYMAKKEKHISSLLQSSDK